MEKESDWEIFWNGEGVWWVESFSSIFVCEFFGGFEILFYMIYFSVECLYYDFIIIFRLEIFELIFYMINYRVEVFFFFETNNNICR